MPSSDESLALAGRHRLGQIALADTVAGFLGEAWTIVDPDLEPTDVAMFGVAAAGVVEHGQAVAVGANDVFLADYLTAETGELYLPTGVDPDRFLGASETDAPLGGILGGGVAAYVRRALDASRPVEEALAYGLSRAQRLARSEIMGAGQRALAFLAGGNRQLRGWRRLTGKRPCAICRRLADGQIMSWSAKVQVHPHCSCMAVPIVRDVPDRVNPPTARDLEVAE